VAGQKNFNCREKRKKREESLISDGPAQLIPALQKVKKQSKTFALIAFFAAISLVQILAHL
jgi:hypothetical protein